jgi:O-antigen/teichoic acid export membrane protein
MQIIGIADILTLTYFRPLSELGIYQMALPTAAIVTLLIAWPVGLMVPATLAHLERKQQQKLIEQMRVLLLAFVVPIVAIIIIFSGEILQILFNHSSVLGAWMLRLLAINQVLLLLIQFSNSTLIGLKRAKALLRISIIVSIVLIAMSIIGTWLFGPIGTILGYFVSFCVFLGLAESAVKKACNAKTPWQAIIKILAIGIFSTGIMCATSKLALPALLNIVVSGAVGLIVYAVLAVWTGILDFELIKNILKR